MFTPTAHEVAAGQTVTTGFVLTVADGAGSASDATTSVVATAQETLPVVTDTSAQQAPTAPASSTSFAPFTYTTNTDPDVGAVEATTITLSVAGVASDADGVLSGAGLTKTGAGTYTLSAASPAAETAALAALAFTPSNPGAEGVVGVTLSVSDGVGPVVTATSSIGLAKNPGGAYVVTNAAETITTYDDTPVSQATHHYSTTVDSVLNGSTAVYERTFNLPYSEPQVQAQASLTNAGAVAGSATLAASNLSTLSRQTTTTQTGSSSQPATVTSFDSFGPSYTGPNTSVVSVARGYFYTLPGQLESNINSVTQTMVSRTVTTMSSDLLTQRYVVASSNSSAPADAYTIAGTRSAQPTNDATAIDPFASLGITDPANPSGTATVTLSAANGSLSNLGAGTLSDNGLTYTVAGTPAALQAALAALVFTPTPHEVRPGTTATTQFTLALSDGAATATDAFTSVVATALYNAPTLTYSGGAGTDIVVGGAAAETITGGTGGGSYFGGGGGTLTAGAGGQSTIVGGNGDSLNAAGPGTVLLGISQGGASFSSAGATGQAVFFGQAGAGRMSFITGAGLNVVGLGQGQNTVTLGSGTATVFGNTGSTATSSVSTGSGTEEIVFGGSSMSLTISAAGAARSLYLFGFAAGPDQVHMQGFSAGQASAAVAAQVQVGPGSMTSLADGTTLWFMNNSHVDASFFI